MTDNTEYVKRLISILDQLYKHRIHDDAQFLITFVAPTVGEAALMMVSAPWPHTHAGNVFMEGIGMDTVTDTELRGDTRAMVFVDNVLYADQEHGFYSAANHKIRTSLELSLITTKTCTPFFLRDLLVPFQGDFPCRDAPNKPIRKFFHGPEGRSRPA